MQDFFDLNPESIDPAEQVIRVRQTLKEIIDFFEKLPLKEDVPFNSYQQYQRFCYKKYIKNIDIKILEESRAFMVPDTMKITDLPLKYRAEQYGLCKNNNLTVAGRMCFPVMDFEENIMGFVAHDKFTQPKYLDIKTYGYIPKKTTLLGMEKMRDYYETVEPVFIPEGLGCMLYLRSRGFKALAALGSYLQPYVLNIIHRIKNPIIVPDSDSAGNKLRTQALKEGFKIFTVPYTLGKDIDDARLVNESIILQMLNNLRKGGI